MQVTKMLEHLDRAQYEVQLVEEQLNDRVQPCTTCGCKVREDFTQYQIREQLAAIRNKLRRYAGSLAAMGSR